MQLRSQMRRLELTVETQLDALAAWREQTSLNIEQSLAVRFNDLAEHLQRVLRHASVVQTDIDALMQIHFSATSERTTATLQFLTVVSVIFLPLNLLAGIFGMNFEYLPLIHDRWAVWLVFGVMLGLALGLFWWSRRRHWLG
jgi:Mg2+ and Co2+ transporter CorA